MFEQEYLDWAVQPIWFEFEKYRNKRKQTKYKNKIMTKRQERKANKKQTQSKYNKLIIDFFV